jgi:hypothetical protein
MYNISNKTLTPGSENVKCFTAYNHIFVFEHTYNTVCTICVVTSEPVFLAQYVHQPTKELQLLYFFKQNAYCCFCQNTITHS